MATRLDEYDSYDQLGENEENKESGEEVQLKRGSDGDKQKEEGGSESIIRKASTRPTFTAEHLTHNEKGLKLIYESFPEDLKLKEGNESNYLNTLIQKYKVWGFNMYPNLAFSDLLNSIEALGNKAQTRNYVADLRDRERNQFMRDVLHIVPSSHGKSPLPSSPHDNQEEDGEGEEEEDEEELVITSNGVKENTKEGYQEGDTEDPSEAAPKRRRKTTSRSISDYEEEGNDEGRNTALYSASGGGNDDEEEDKEEEFEG